MLAWVAAGAGDQVDEHVGPAAYVVHLKHKKFKEKVAWDFIKFPRSGTTVIPTTI